MYRNILKKDLKRKKTMNFILLVFIILAVTLISAGVSNLISIATALEDYARQAGVWDYEVFISSEQSMEAMKRFAEEKDYITDYQLGEMLLLSRNEVKVNGKRIDYSNTIGATSMEEASCNFFDENDEKLKEIKKGEIYLTPVAMKEFQAEPGDRLIISNESFSKDFTIAGYAKDIICGSPMVGMTRILINGEDYNEMLQNTDLPLMYDCAMEIENMEQMQDELNQSGISIVFYIEPGLLKNMYVMDMVLAAVLMLVSICLIVISMLVLKFTISFTIDEEFREIGVMKAIGIRVNDIRKLYIIKYFMIALTGGVIGFAASIPFGKVMLKQAMENIVMTEQGNLWINLVCSILVVMLVMVRSFRATGRIRKMKPLEAIRNGSTGERFKGRGLFTMEKLRVKPVVFLAVNDISSKWKQFLILFFTFTVGILLIILPINTINTLTSDGLVEWFSMTKSDVCMSKENIFNDKVSKKDVLDELEYVKEVLAEHQMEARVHQEIMFRMSAVYGEHSCTSLAFQGAGDVTAEEYAYLEGTPPQQENEVAITHVIAEKLDAGIGDTIQLYDGREKKDYLVTALFQSMNNMGEGIRFHENAELPYELAGGSFSVQVRFSEELNDKEMEEWIEKTAELFPDYEVQSCGAYINDMMGGISEQVEGIKKLIIIIVIIINILVSLLMEKTLLTREKGEIGMLKAIGFWNPSLIVWQLLRIGLILFAAAILGTALSTPFSKLTTGWVFLMMGAASIEFDINPWEVYGVYPLLVLAVTVFASYFGARAIRKISALETSNIE